MICNVAAYTSKVVKDEDIEAYHEGHSDSITLTVENLVD